MKSFWAYARLLLHYRSLLITGLIFALLDAACAFSGFGTLMLIVDLLFKEGASLQTMVGDLLGQGWLVAVIGDRSAWARSLPQDPFPSLATVMAVVWAFTLLGTTFRFLYQWCVLTAVLRTIMRIRQACLKRLIRQPVYRLGDESSGEKLSRVVRDSTELSRGFNALLGKAVRDGLMGFSFLSLALVFNWQLTAVFLLCLPPIAIVIRKFGKRIRRATKAALAGFGRMTNALQSGLQSLPVVKVHLAEGYERRRFNVINRELLAQEVRARTARALASPVTELIAITGVIGVTLVAGWMVFLRGTAEAGDVLQVLGPLGMAANALRPLTNLNNELQAAAAAATRLDHIVHAPVEDRRLNRPALPRHRRSIAIEGVSFTYPGNAERALHDVSFEARFGEHIAIVGANGSGKSTLVQLLPGLLVPDAGRVLIDGHDIADHNLPSLRRQMAMVTQQTVLFEGTIAQNIAYGWSGADRALIEQAGRSALADEFIRQLPRGYDTPLGEAGAGLSGGQRQRLCIARALLRDPAILILDEATSQVDADSEARIQQALALFRKGRTTLTIAHRLSTVVDADRILVLNRGRLEAQGTHEQLLASSTTYQALTRTQLSGGAA